MAAEGIGRGPLGHPVSSGPVSRMPGAQKPIIFDKFIKNLEVPSMGLLRAQLRPRKGKEDQISLPKFPGSKIFDFPKIAPPRLWGNVGMARHAETCSKQLARASRAASLPSHGVVLQSRQSSGYTAKGKEGQGQPKSHYENF